MTNVKASETQPKLINDTDFSTLVLGICMRERGKTNTMGHSRDKTVIKTQVTSVADMWNWNGKGKGKGNGVGAV